MAETNEMPPKPSDQLQSSSKRPCDSPEATAVGKKRKKQTFVEGRADRKRKVAMLLVYSGSGYIGMQINPGFRTIESELIAALHKTGVIPEEHAQTIQKMKFQRAARTDKGVSAAGQIVSLNMLVNVENFVEKINNYLPEDIRVIGVKRATSGFDSKRACSGRTYKYMLPTFALCPIEQITSEVYRVKPETIDLVNELLSQYKGTHNFHNFTSGKKPEEQSARRYIMDINCSQSFEQHGLELVTIKIQGQSFMIHQIRKMIGLMIAIVRGLAVKESIDRAWKPEKYDVPRAPGLGLMLESVHYEYYNKKYGNDGMHQTLEWHEYSDVINKFKEDHIYPTIINTEKEKKSMMEWLATLPLHHFDVLDTRCHPIRQTPLGQALVMVDSEKKAQTSVGASGTEIPTRQCDTSVDDDDVDDKPSNDDQGTSETGRMNINNSLEPKSM